MTIDFLLLIALVIGFLVYVVFMSMWWEEEKLKLRHFYILALFLAGVLLQALAV